MADFSENGWHISARIRKRQVELLAARSVVDFEAFYENVSRMQGNQGEVLVLSVDGKGIVKRSAYPAYDDGDPQVS